MPRLLPRNEQFYDLFRQAATNASEISRALSDLLIDCRDAQAKVQQIESLEKRGDDITHRVIEELSTTFLAPFDREDIQDLAKKLDDFVDFITGAAGRIHLYNISQPTKKSQLLGRIIAEQGEAIAAAVNMLAHDDQRTAILGCIREINRLEDEADEVFGEALAEVYDKAEDIQSLVAAIHWKELYQRLEDTTDRGEDLANTLEAIIAK